MWDARLGFHDVKCLRDGKACRLPIRYAVNTENDARDFLVTICEFGDGSETCRFCVKKATETLRKNPFYYNPVPEDRE